eukprot:TRINITY_DN44668_c0_g1_i1.p1 TRINITY_DN44668_c0_g1~~TRINITY_DN44668_c0_g1_i1.p1  ORF type:complete len:502 (-),score=120.18 TRINITY_DN44668_c0_g1_i1:177-1682(-)
MKDVFRGVEESFSGMKFTRPSWLSGATSSSSKPAPQQSVPSAPRVVSNDGARRTPVPAAESNAPAELLPNTGEDDAVMRRHCAALERIVDIGLSLPAARIALKHLDTWLVGEEGIAEMAAAEEAAITCGEPILHAGDRVRLEGLVKNHEANGKLGVVEAYDAQSFRWKVRMVADNQVFWIKPKLLRPLEVKRISPPQKRSSPQESSGCDQTQLSSQEPEQVVLEAAWAKLKARQAAWKEEQESREIQLLEREEALQKLQEALEAAQEEQEFFAQRQAAKKNEEVEAARAQDQRPPEVFEVTCLSGYEGERSPAHLSPLSPLQAVTSYAADETSIRPVAEHEDEEQEEAEADEVWDMDWSSMASQSTTAAHSRQIPTSSTSCASDSLSCNAGLHDDSTLEPSSDAGTGYRSSRVQRLREPSPPSGHSAQLNTSDLASFTQKMEEKRRLAELHNGEDLTEMNRAEFDKGSMPGVHPSMAAKLEERRRRLDAAEEAPSTASGSC